jgi:hypothetical protein
MQKRNWFLFAFLVSTFALNAQDTAVVKEAVDRLQRSLIARDTMALKQLLHKDLRFGHSNGWVQKKREVIEDAKSGSLVYEVFNRESLEIEVFDQWAYVRERTQVRGQRDGKSFEVKLFVVQQWVRTKKGWQLKMRQGAKQG